MVAENTQRKQELLNLWQPDRRTKKCPATRLTKQWFLSLKLKFEQANGFTLSVFKNVKPIRAFN